MEKVGIILAGGGGKGAYEVGAWRSLQALISELDLEVTAYAGTSVGALNAALFACDSVAEAEIIWNQVTPLTILKPDAMKILLMNLQITNMPFFSLVYQLWEDGMFSRDGLIKLIQAAQIRERIESCGKPIFATCLNESTQKAEYILLNRENCEKILLASSAIPFVFAKEYSENTTTYRDGGFTKNGDNLPFFPLLNQGYKKFIVIHLDETEYVPDEDLSGCKMYHIFPSKSLNGLWGTLDFTPKSVKKKQELGRDDVVFDYSYREEIRRMFSETTDQEVHYAHGKTYSSLNEMYLDRKINVENETELSEAIEKECTEIEVKNHKMIRLIDRIRNLDKKQIAMIFGGSVVGPLLKLLSHFGSPDIIKKIQAYNIKRKSDGSVILFKENKADIKEVKNNLKDFMKLYKG